MVSIYATHTAVCQAENRVFAEKTVPTSMVIAMLAWGLMTPRVQLALSKRTCDFVNDIVERCTSTTTPLELTLIPEYLPRS
jgi:hypothetical protein